MDEIVFPVPQDLWFKDISEIFRPYRKPFDQQFISRFETSANRSGVEKPLWHGKGEGVVETVYSVNRDPFRVHRYTDHLRIEAYDGVPGFDQDQYKAGGKKAARRQTTVIASCTGFKVWIFLSSQSEFKAALSPDKPVNYSQSTSCSYYITWKQERLLSVVIF